MICILLLAGCGSPAAKTGTRAENGGSAVKGDGSGDREKPPEKPDPKAEIDLSLKPNEAGKVMVLMYHNIGAEEAEWVRTPANFRKDLEVLYEKGYRPVSLKDYVNGNVTVEQGRTPVVLTFDDGNLNNFEYLDDGQINPDSAAGLLVDFHEKHKDFPLEATFFVYGEQPFRQNGLISEKLNYIIEKGMDVGNHTKDHNGFRNAGAEEIQEQIGAEAQYLQNVLGGVIYEIDMLALPFGERPKDEAMKQYLASGSWNGKPYQNIAILNVGWNPAPSPYDKKFDPAGIPRVRASETNVDNVGLYNYLDYFDRHPEERFISDGVPEIITVPEGKKDIVQSVGGKEIYAY